MLCNIFRVCLDKKVVLLFFGQYEIRVVPTKLSNLFSVPVRQAALMRVGRQPRTRPYYCTHVWKQKSNELCHVVAMICVAKIPIHVIIHFFNQTVQQSLFRSFVSYFWFARSFVGLFVMRASGSEQLWQQVLISACTTCSYLIGRITVSQSWGNTFANMQSMWKPRG